MIGSTSCSRKMHLAAVAALPSHERDRMPGEPETFPPSSCNGDVARSMRWNAAPRGPPCTLLHGQETGPATVVVGKSIGGRRTLRPGFSRYVHTWLGIGKVGKSRRGGWAAASIRKDEQHEPLATCGPTARCCVPYIVQHLRPVVSLHRLAQPDRSGSHSNQAPAAAAIRSVCDNIRGGVTSYRAVRGPPSGAPVLVSAVRDLDEVSEIRKMWWTSTR